MKITPKVKTYLEQVANRAETIFKMYGWTYAKDIPTKEQLLSTLIEITESITKQDWIAECGRFLIKKTSANEVGIEAYIELNETEWLYPLVASSDIIGDKNKGEQ